MISAEHAREVTESSIARLDQRLEQIGSMIHIQARLGKNSVMLDEHTDSVYKVEKEEYRPVEYTSAQMLIKQRLEDMGYTVKHAPYEYKAVDEYGELIRKTGYRIVVSW